MGFGGASGAAERSDAGRLTGIGAGPEPGVDMGHSGDALSGCGWVKVGVEDARLGAKLQLEAVALADLQGWRAEALDQVGRGEADQVAAFLHNRRFGLWGHRGRLWRGRASRDEQSCKGEIAAHRATMARAISRSKLAAFRADR